MGAWRLGGVEVSDFRSWYEEYGQLIPAIDERRTPTFTEHAAFADENRERARAALDGPCPDIGAVRVLAEHDPADAPRPVGRPAPRGLDRRRAAARAVARCAPVALARRWSAGALVVAPVMAAVGQGHVLAAGTLEARFLSTTDSWHDSLRAAGAVPWLAHRVNGPDWRFWREEVAVALALLAS